MTRKDADGRTFAFPDTLVGTDSHTTMINGLGVLGWGVGGIEAEAAMLGQPIPVLTPVVIGVRLTGQMKPGVTATDLALTVTQMLRKKGVVEQFVEFFGPGLDHLTLADRATVANMAPEYGATTGLFPIDGETLRYMRETGRTEQEVELVEKYCRAQGIFRTKETAEPTYNEVLSLDLASVEPSVSGPKRPHDRMHVKDLKKNFRASLAAPVKDRGYGLADGDLARSVSVAGNGTLSHGSVVIASITSCTNTSNPHVLLAAGLVAQKAVALGWTVARTVKTSLAPGSRVVTEYLEKAGLLPYLEKLGFNVAAYGCTTCIGNAGPLAPEIEKTVVDNNLVCTAVLSGNRNFEARIHPNIKGNFLASPPLVVAYAIAGTVRRDLMTEPVGYGKGGKPVYLGDIWPSGEEVAKLMKFAMNPKVFKENYAQVATHPGKLWKKIEGVKGQIYDWPKSTYIAEPPFFAGFGMQPAATSLHVRGARALALFGDSITTDHISPAGSIKDSSPAGQWLQANGVLKADFNSYGSRRGNHEVMMRGTFANVRIKNLMIPAAADGSREEGGVTLFQPSGEKMFIYDAAMRYIAEGTPTVIFAGEEYGTGSSRDWAAKGTQLLGVKAVVARSFERIHRSNLVGMGVLPLQFLGNDSWESLGIQGNETFAIELGDSLRPQQDALLIITRADGSKQEVKLKLRIDTPIEVDYYQHGGILPFVLRQLLAA